MRALTVQPDAAQAGSHLVFHKYKNMLALSEVFPGDGSTGYQLVRLSILRLAAPYDRSTIPLPK
jgi:hypothetical protein